MTSNAALAALPPVKVNRNSKFNVLISTSQLLQRRATATGNRHAVVAPLAA